MHPPTQLTTMVAHTNVEVETQNMLVDSGANAYITADPTTINNPQPFDGNETMGVGNGTCFYIQGIGSYFPGSLLILLFPYQNFSLKTFFTVLLFQLTYYQSINFALTIIASLNSLDLVSL